VLAAAIAGYATHGLLDACTTYGTQLFWPFSDYRVAWNNVSIIDPIFTLALVAGIITGSWRKSQRPATIALIFCITYLILGAVQRDRAMEVQEVVAASRGHERSRGEVFPTIGNHLVWRSLYQSGDTFHADRIRVPWFGAKTWAPGTSVAAVDESDLPDSIRSNPRLLDDFRRFSWFSSDWIARPPDDSSVIGDVRYSLRTEAFDPIWGIRFHPDEPVPIEWVDRTRRREIGVGELWEEITGARGDYREAP
jgi:inner membrane protein